MNNKISMFSKLLLLFLAVVLILCLFSTGINLIARKRARDELLTMSEARMSYYLSTLNNEMKNILKVLEQYSTDYDLNLLVYSGEEMSPYERMHTFSDLQRELFRSCSNSGMIESAGISVRYLKRTVSSEFILRDMDEGWFDYLAENFSREGSCIEEYGEKLYVSRSYPISYRDEKSPDYIVFCELDRKAMEEELMLLCEDSAFYSILTDEKGSWYMGSSWIYQELAHMEDSLLGEAAPEDVYIKTSDNREYCVKYAGDPYTGLRMYSLIPAEYIRNSGAWYNILFILLLAAAAVLVLLYYMALNRLLRKPMRELMSAFDQVKAGDLNYQIHHSRSDEFSFLYKNFNEMMEQLDKLTREVARQENLVVQAELKQLQYQINPHFLYNSLYAIYRLAKEEEVEAVSDFARYLSGYYRYITRSSSLPVKLSQEIEHCRYYLKIQECRFGNRIHVYFEEPKAQWENVTVPPLILQPILENAFGHALERMEGEGRLSLRFEQEGGDLLCLVDDNGPGMTKEQMDALKRQFEEEARGPVTGLVNVHKRIRGLQGEGYGIRISESVWGGLRVTLRIKGEGYVSHSGGG